MRVLYASERPPYPFFLGGAARCAHQLLYNMANDLGIDCAAVGSGDYRVSPWSYPDAAEYVTLGIRGTGRDGQNGTLDCGYPVQVLPDFANTLGDFIDAFRPDVIWAQLEGAREILELAGRKGIPGLFYVHDAEFKPAELRAIANLNCHMVCSSGFLAGKVRRVIGREAKVVYPASEWYFGTSGDPDGYVTMINPFQVKGIDTFFEIAKRLPLEKFLLLESWKLNEAALAKLEERLAQAPNVRFRHRVSDMRSIYGQTKLLLVPSVWEEGFGMVAVEAQSCRVPVIASARGGLPESVGDGGILIQDYRNAEEWVEAIGAALRDRAAYDEWSDRAFRHAGSADFQPGQLARRFLEICSAGVRRPNAYTRGVRSMMDYLERMPLFGGIFRQPGR
jgi:glycosyltransferase involved in cell wall biosynthesis